MEQARCISQQFVNYYETAKVHSESTLEFLREESNLMPRVGAIGIGGLTGYVFGLRRGPVMRAIYSTLGATAIAALCYPKETEEYSQQGLSLTKKYIIITYHFLNGGNCFM
ncbi:hypothetical protein AAG570_000740 [Ranatra chinensis]|uniref:MICOS complex subunit n=1 Tax=Ranatra chinensis TaxID=642074 RepID=A0ABD0ZAM2_9HEMI